MANELIEIWGMDIYAYPDSFKEHDEVSEALGEIRQLTIGDLHSNAIKLIHFLLQEKVINLAKDDFNELVELYKKKIRTKKAKAGSLYSDSDDKVGVPEAIEEKIELDETSFNAENLHSFKRIVDRITVSSPTFIRLIGDTLADRGQNDYYILLILSKLRGLGLPFEVLLSNHDIEFIMPCEQGTEFFSDMSFSSQTNSMDNMKTLIGARLVARQEIEETFKQAYLPALRLISYSLDDVSNTISLYSHAPVGTEAVECLAKKFGVAFKDDSRQALAHTIDQINIKFMTDYARQGEVNKLPVSLRGSDRPEFITPEEDVITHIMWNRNYHIVRKPVHKGYSVNYIHGHDLTFDDSGYIFNLDNSLGKDVKRNKEGMYKMLASNDLPVMLDVDYKVEKGGSAAPSSLPGGAAASSKLSFFQQGESWQSPAEDMLKLEEQQNEKKLRGTK